jgi:hypothetical protein
MHDAKSMMSESQPSCLSDVMCCVCGLELTIQENEENLTYDVRERICDKCNSELSEGRKHWL